MSSNCLLATLLKTPSGYVQRRGFRELLFGFNPACPGLAIRGQGSAIRQGQQACLVQRGGQAAPFFPGHRREMIRAAWRRALG